jgi:predicted DNA-binding transcriptional regulator AlpA
MQKILIDYEGLRRIGIKYSREHLRRLELTGRFPLRYQIGDLRRAWLLSEIEAWIASRPTGPSPREGDSDA